MKLLKKLYIGLKNDASESIIKGFIIEDGNSKIHLKNRIKVDNWRDKNLEPILIENTPMNGYVITKVLALRGSMGNSKCRVQIKSPLGFEFWLSPKSIHNLLLHCKIDNGVILDELVIVMDGEISLIPKNKIPSTPPKEKKEYIKQSDISHNQIYKTANGDLYSYGQKHKLFNLLDGSTATNYVYLKLSYSYSRLLYPNNYFVNDILLTNSKKVFVEKIPNVTVEIKDLNKLLIEKNLHIIDNDEFQSIIEKPNINGIFCKYIDYYAVFYNNHTHLFTLNQDLSFSVKGTLNFKLENINNFDLILNFKNNEFTIDINWLIKKGIFKK